MMGTKSFSHFRKLFFSYGITFIVKKKNSFQDVMDKDFDTFIKLPRKWVEDQDLSNFWTITHIAIDGDDETTQLTIEGKKQFLDISDADFVARGERNYPDVDIFLVCLEIK